MPLQRLEEALRLFSSLKGSLVGVGMTGYSRILPSYLIQPYHIIALRRTGDLHILRKRAQIFCLEEEIGEPVKDSGFHSARLLSHPLVRKYLKDLPDPKYVLLYQSYAELEELAYQEGWILLANPAALRIRVGERLFFHHMIEELQLDGIPGCIVPIDELWAKGYRHWAEELGPSLAVQLPEVRQGGGKGTFFLSSERQFNILRERLREGTWRGCGLERASVRKFIQAVPASFALCITRHGILVSGPQRQLIDLPYLRGIPERGVFCGHSWGQAPWPDHSAREALTQAEAIGGFLGRMGYRGILGLDLVIESGSGRVYPVEVNPRFTGAFPMLSQLHVQKGLIPLDAFHMAEFMDLSWEADPVRLNGDYRAPIKGSHLLMFRLGRGPGAIARARGGLYEWSPRGGYGRFVEDTMDYGDMRNDRQFIVIDGPPVGDVGSDDPLYRLCRLLFPCPVVGPEGRVQPQALQAAEWVYERIAG